MYTQMLVWINPTDNIMCVGIVLGELWITTKSINQDIFNLTDKAHKMENHHKELLQMNRERLVEELDDHVFDKMIQKQIFTTAKIEEFKVHTCVSFSCP